MICCKCKKEIKGGCYNAPSGVHCIDCWGSKAPEAKQKETKKAMRILSNIAKVASKSLKL